MLTHERISQMILDKEIFYIMYKYNMSGRRAIQILNSEYNGNLDHEDISDTECFGLNLGRELNTFDQEDIDSKFPIYTPEEFLEAYLGEDYLNFRPVTGERVNVWDDDESDCIEHIFLADIGNPDDAYPIICVNPNYEDEYNEGIFYDTVKYRFMSRVAGEEYQCDSNSKKSTIKESIRSSESVKEAGGSQKSIEYSGSKCDEKSNSISVSGSISGGTPSNIIQPGSSYSGLPVNRRRVLV